MSWSGWVPLGDEESEDSSSSSGTRRPGDASVAPEYKMSRFSDPCAPATPAPPLQLLCVGGQPSAPNRLCSSGSPGLEGPSPRLCQAAVSHSLPSAVISSEDAPPHHHSLSHHLASCSLSPSSPSRLVLLVYCPSPQQGPCLSPAKVSPAPRTETDWQTVGA